FESAGLDAGIELRRDWRVALLVWIIEIKHVFDLRRIEAVAHEIDLPKLERACRFDRRRDAEKYRARVAGQFALEIVTQAFEFEIFTRRDRGHASAAIDIVDLDAIDVGFIDAGIARDHFGHLCRRNVFALPAERVADAIDEIRIAVFVLAHQIAGAEPRVAFVDGITLDLAFRRGIVAAAGVIMPRIVLDQAAGLSGFTGRAQYAQAVLIAHRHFGFDVEPHQPHREITLQIGRHAADRAGLAVEIEHRDVAFGRAIEFHDPL